VIRVSSIAQKPCPVDWTRNRPALGGQVEVGASGFDLRA
jgi:hypothetical protein